MRYCWGHSQDFRVPAVYLWTASPSGNEIPLCAECCAAWRAGAVAEPELAPARIQLLPGAQ